MHVVMVGDYPGGPGRLSGGVEAVVFYLLQALQTYADFKLGVITLSKRGSEKRTVQYGKVTVHYIPRARLPGRLSIMANIRHIRDELLRINPDLIHAHIAGEYADAAAQTGIPWVLTLHGIRFLEAAMRPDIFNRVYRGFFIKQEELRVISQAKHIISISPFIQETFSKYIAGEVYDIENPIIDPFFQLPELPHQSNFQLLFAGRIIPRKGIHILLQAFSEVFKKIPEVKLRLAGGSNFSKETGNYLEQLQQFVTNNNLENSVTFLGELNEEEILEEYKNCSVLVLSSVLETAPMVIMQALSAGRPVVSTDAGGTRYLIEHEKTGFIVPVNDIHNFSNILYNLLNNQSRLREIGHRAREVAKNRFHANIVAEKTRKVYSNIIEQSTSSI